MILYPDYTTAFNDLNWLIEVDGAPTTPDSISWLIRWQDNPEGPSTVASGDGIAFATGAYYAEWEIPANAVPGEYLMVWSWTIAGQTHSGTQAFTLANAAVPSTIITVDQAYNEGVPRTYTRSQVEQRIAAVQDYIHRVTRQYFVPMTTPYLLDGTGTKLLKLPAPLRALQFVEFELATGQFYKQENRSFVLYCRTAPDDERFYPRMEVKQADEVIGNIYSGPGLRAAVFPEGTQNIRITGTWGFVEDDLRAPKAIQQAAVLLLRKWLPPYGSDAWRRLQRSGQVVSESTIGHSYQLERTLKSGDLTGDPDIDLTLIKYSRGGQVTSA